MKRFDVAISFAGEDREIAAEFARGLKARGAVVFYDDDLQAELLGENLTEYLIDVYRDDADYCIVLISESYIKKRWSRHEWRAAQERAFLEFDQAYILPVRLDDTELPGMLSTIGYLSVAKHPTEKLIDILYERLEGSIRKNKIVRNAERLFRSGEFHGCIEKFESLVSVQSLSGDRVALRLWADSLMCVGNYQDPIRILEAVVRDFPDDAESHFILGVCLARQERFEEARAAYEQCISINPNHGVAAAELKELSEPRNNSHSVFSWLIAVIKSARNVQSGR